MTINIYGGFGPDLDIMWGLGPDLGIFRGYGTIGGEWALKQMVPDSYKKPLFVSSLSEQEVIKGDGHLDLKSAQSLVLLKLLILLVNIYMVDVKCKYLSCQRK